MGNNVSNESKDEVVIDEMVPIIDEMNYKPIKKIYNIDVRRREVEKYIKQENLKSYTMISLINKYKRQLFSEPTKHIKNPEMHPITEDIVGAIEMAENHLEFLEKKENEEKHIESLIEQINKFTAEYSGDFVENIKELLKNNEMISENQIKIDGLNSMLRMIEKILQKYEEQPEIKQKRLYERLNERIEILEKNEREIQQKQDEYEKMVQEQEREYNYRWDTPYYIGK